MIDRFRTASIAIYPVGSRFRHPDRLIIAVWLASVLASYVHLALLTSC